MGVVGRSVSTARAGAAAAVRAAITESMVRDAPGFWGAWEKVDLVPGWMTQASASIFWGTIAHRTPRTIVEIGTYQGRSSVLIGFALQRFVPGGRLVTVDPHTGGKRVQTQLGREQPTTELLCRAHLEGLRLTPDPVEIRVARSADAAAEWTDGPIDLLYIDGWHTYDAARDDALAWAPHLAPDALVVWDDCGNFPDVAAGARDACAQLGITWWNTILGQGWAGHGATPPAPLPRAYRFARLRAR